MLNNDLVDPYSSDIDLIVRIGDLSDSSLVARYLGDYEMCYCAAPGYLNQHAEICVLEDLAQHPSLGFSYSSRRDVSGRVAQARGAQSSESQLLAPQNHQATHSAVNRTASAFDVEQWGCVAICSPSRRRRVVTAYDLSRRRN